MAKGKPNNRTRSYHKGQGVKAPIKQKMTKRNSSRQQREEKEIADTGAAMSRSNPIEFYNKFSQYVKDAATLPFSLPVGEFFNIGIRANGQEFPVNKQAAPGLMRIRFTPVIGVSNDFTSPINQTSIKFWTYLRSIQKAAAAYDHQDITMMEIAIDSCIMFHSLMRRMYGLLGDYTPVNLYYPRTLVQASGGNYDDLKQNISDFRMYINQFAYNLQQYALPKGIELFKRHQWMCEGIYTDSQATRAQTYMFVPNGFYQYDNTVDTGSQLTFKYWITAGNGAETYTFADIVEFGNSLLNALSNDEDFAYISGDMYNFFNGDTFTLPYLEEGYKILPLYDETVLSQIENATIVGTLGSDSLVISQNPNVNQGAVIQQPYVSIQSDRLFRRDATLNFHHDQPTSDQVIEATRLTATLKEGANGARANIEYCGTELVTAVDVYNRNPLTGLFRFNTINDMDVYINSTSDANTFASYLQDLLLLASFDWAPRIELWNYVPNTTDPTLSTITAMGLSWDIDNLQNLPSEYLRQIHRACLMSLFVTGSYN